MVGSFSAKRISAIQPSSEGLRIVSSPSTSSARTLVGKEAEKRTQMDPYKYVLRLANDNFWIGLVSLVLAALAALVDVFFG